MDGNEIAAPKKVRVLLVCGSLQRASANRAAVDAAAAALVARGVEVGFFEGLGAIPAMNPDRGDDPGEAVLTFRAQLGASDGVIIAAPEYAGGVAGVVKNALDWIVGSGEFYGKPVALVSAGTSGGVLARRDLVRTLSWQGGHVVASLGIEGPSPKSVTDPNGSRRFTDPTTLEEIGVLTASLVTAIGQRPMERLPAVSGIVTDAGVDPARVAVHMASQEGLAKPEDAR